MSDYLGVGSPECWASNWPGKGSRLRATGCTLTVARSYP